MQVSFFLTVKWLSAIAWPRGYKLPPPIGLLTKMQNKENTTFLALLRFSFAVE